MGVCSRRHGARHTCRKNSFSSPSTHLRCTCSHRTVRAGHSSWTGSMVSEQRTGVAAAREPMSALKWQGTAGVMAVKADGQGSAGQGTVQQLQRTPLERNLQRQHALGVVHRLPLAVLCAHASQRWSAPNPSPALLAAIASTHLHHPSGCAGGRCGKLAVVVGR